jgi:pimeloyl-ACP methyl ester carboxylesterase
MLAGKPTNIEGNLNNIHIPVLVITGKNDRIVPAEQSIRLAKELPGAQIVVIPQCGHVPQEECPQAVLEAIDKFLQNNDLTPIRQ